MTKYEYRAIACPPPSRRELSPGADPFDEALTAAINDLAEDGWSYLRADTIGVRVRRFLRSTTEQRCFLVFRREAEAAAEPRLAVELRRDAPAARVRRIRPAGKVEFIRSARRSILPTPANSDGRGSSAAAE